MYGIVVVLFFQCMGALLNPVNRKGGVQWGLVAHTTTMFSLATVYIAMYSNVQSISFVDNREFPLSLSGAPGPMGYNSFVHSWAIGMAPTVALYLNNWLADGLLLYRCYVVYSKSYRVIAFPYLMYLASLVTGIMFMYKSSLQGLIAAEAPAAVQFEAPFFAISFALNILVTLMIVARLLIHRMKMQKAMGATTYAGGWCMASITIIVESYALCAIAVILFLGAWGARSFLQFIFLQVIAQTQVIAPFLITLRIANRRAFTSDSFTSTNVSSIHFRDQPRLTCSSGSHSDEYPAGPMDAGEFGIEIETVIDLKYDSAPGSQGTLGN